VIKLQLLIGNLAEPGIENYRQDYVLVSYYLE